LKKILRKIYFIKFLIFYLLLIKQDDEEACEYLKQLRYEIITAFTSISFCLDDCDKKSEFVQYVPTIFTFIKTIATDNYEPTCVIL